MSRKVFAVSLFLLFFCAFCLYAANQPISIGMIPDAGATQVSVQEKEPLKSYLAKKLGQEVNLVIPTNYNATVEALGNGSLDFAYLGGLTYVKAHRQYGVVPLVQRTSDLEFHSLFITGANSPIKSLADLKGKRIRVNNDIVKAVVNKLMPALFPQKPVKLFPVYIGPVEDLLLVVPQRTFTTQISIVGHNLDRPLCPKTVFLP